MRVLYVAWQLNACDLNKFLLAAQVREEWLCLVFCVPFCLLQVFSG